MKGNIQITVKRDIKKEREEGKQENIWKKRQMERAEIIKQ